MGDLIAVLSGKGGTGKTSLTAAVASCLAALGHRVLCIDRMNLHDGVIDPVVMTESFEL